MSSPKAECDFLMNAVLPFAEKMLLKNGGFFPYGGALDPNGEAVAVEPPSNDVILLLKQAFLQGAKSGVYKATALVYDVRVTLPSSEQKSDAIAVSLDHREDYPVIVFFPYEIKEGRLQFGEAFAQKGKTDIFKNPRRVHDAD